MYNIGTTYTYFLKNKNLLVSLDADSEIENIYDTIMLEGVQILVERGFPALFQRVKSNIKKIVGGKRKKVIVYKHVEVVHY